MRFVIVAPSWYFTLLLMISCREISPITQSILSSLCMLEISSTLCGYLLKTIYFESCSERSDQHKSHVWPVSIMFDVASLHESFVSIFWGGDFKFGGEKSYDLV